MSIDVSYNPYNVPTKGTHRELFEVVEKFLEQYTPEILTKCDFWLSEEFGVNATKDEGFPVYSKIHKIHLNKLENIKLTWELERLGWLGGGGKSTKPAIIDLEDERWRRSMLVDLYLSLFFGDVFTLPSLDEVKNL